MREENHLKPPIYEAIDIIETIPEMPDVAEVRHGKPRVVTRKRWVNTFTPLKDGLYSYKKILVEDEEEFCPFCGKELGVFDSYCGNCGAKMDGEEQEHE